MMLRKPPFSWVMIRVVFFGTLTQSTACPGGWGRQWSKGGEEKGHPVNSMP